MKIHPSAIISKKAKLDSDVSVGPFAVIGENVSIGKGTVVGAHCLIDGRTTIGKNCQIFSGAVVGSRPQDLKYKGGKVYLEIGDENIIREYCTFNPGTHEGGKTVIGNNNLFMAYSHIAHDCVIGHHCVIANNGTCAGYVTIEDKAVIGGIVAIHQFVRIGTLSIIGGCSKVVSDIPPFSTCDGHPAAIYGLNRVGLKRHNVAKESIDQLHHAFKILFNQGLTLKHGLEKAQKEVKQTKEVIYLLSFIKSSQRGIAHSCRKR
ncbi:MAG: acyl-ACP--UDP-N-acetylglucosamine O-acyltransferase [Candidatus Omnitrophota bacterium]